jgi:glycosyltransferase involved in cell wall biosynthesis
MRLLLVFPFVPYPPNDGGRIGFWNPIHYLSRRHEVHVACLATKDDAEHCEALKAHCASLHVLRREMSSKPVQAIQGVLGYPPGTARKYWDSRFNEVIRRAIETHEIELVEFHHLNAAAYRESAGTLPAVLREHNIEHVVWERHARLAPLLERSYARLVASRVKRYEAEISPKFDRCVVVSPADGEYLRRVSPAARIEMIPSGVDTEYFRPNPEVAEEPNRMVMTGSFAWPPKQHNLRVILEQIMPLIRARAPQTTLIVVGKGIPAHLQRLAARTPGVTLTGCVPDVRPYVWSASLLLNYLESGGGIALKILEGFAMRKAVLSNRLGCEGIEVVHDREIFLAENPEAIAEAAVQLLSDPALRHRLADQGHELVNRKYAWQIIAGQFDAMYASVRSERAAPATAVMT